jgi:acetyltransferase-like isoleucine patch superfamily enzyme
MQTKEMTMAPGQSLEVKQPALLARKYQDHYTGGPNAHKYWYQARNHLNGPILGPLLIFVYYTVIEICKHLPSLTFKRWIFQRLGMRLGRDVTIASGAMLDYFFPELIEIGDNTIIGMGALILTHEFLHNRFRSGPVRIGANCLVGANSTLLAGVWLADGTKVAAMSLVNKGTSTGVVVAGVPIRILATSDSNGGDISI